MPNAPVPAAATGLPASRRGFLAGLALAPLPPLSPATSAPHPDAELLDLWHRRCAAWDAARVASQRHDDILAVTAYPELPEALFVQGGDDALGFAGLSRPRWCGRRWYPVYSAGSGVPAERLRRPQMRQHLRVPRPEEGYPSYVHEIASIVPWPEAQARADAIVEAWDGHQAQLVEIRETSGLAAAEAEWDALDDARAALDGAIRDATARTVDGLRIKAQLAQLDLDEDIEPEPALIAGLVRDLLALGNIL